MFFKSTTKEKNSHWLLLLGHISNQHILKYSTVIGMGFLSQTGAQKQQERSISIQVSAVVLQLVSMITITWTSLSFYTYHDDQFELHCHLKLIYSSQSRFCRGIVLTLSVKLHNSGMCSYVFSFNWKSQT